MSGSSDVPGWIEVVSGDAPCLLFAPHGGRRHGARHPARHKVNDLYTAELTRQLRTVLNATSIVNAAHDRNALDLNRIAQVETDAPWLLALLARTLTDMVARHGHAMVLAIHGWNVVQAACDVGIGVVDGTEGPDDTCTVSPMFRVETLTRLRHTARARDIALTIGARYPAAHPNNLLQLFTPRRHEAGDPSLRTLARLAASGRLDAVQLELGIPLRWPGEPRRRFIEALAETLRPHSGAAASGDPGAGATPDARRSEPETTLLGCGGRIVRRRGFRFADDHLLGLASIDAGAAGAVAGRLLVSPAPDQLFLFTGELARRDGARWSVPPLEFVEEADLRCRVRFRGPLLSFPRLTPFLDLEGGLAEARVVEGRVDLCAVRDGARGAPEDPPCCWIEGTIDVAHHRWSVATVAFGSDDTRRVPSHDPRIRLLLSGTPLGDLALDSYGPAAEPTASPARAGGDWRPCIHFAVHRHGAGPGAPAIDGRCELAVAPERISVSLAVRDAAGRSWQTTGAADRLIPVRRGDARGGGIVCTTYARCQLREAGPGWLELSQREPFLADLGAAVRGAAP